MSFFCDNCDGRMGTVKTNGTLRYRRCVNCDWRCWTEEVPRYDIDVHPRPGRPVVYKRKTHVGA